MLAGARSRYKSATGRGRDFRRSVPGAGLPELGLIRQERTGGGEKFVSPDRPTRSSGDFREEVWSLDQGAGVSQPDRQMASYAAYPRWVWRNYFRRCRLQAANPARPEAKRRRVEGSGTALSCN